MALHSSNQITADEARKKITTSKAEIAKFNNLRSTICSRIHGACGSQEEFVIVDHTFTDVLRALDGLGFKLLALPPIYSNDELHYEISQTKVSW